LSNKPDKLLPWLWSWRHTNSIICIYWQCLHVYTAAKTTSFNVEFDII